MDETTEYVHDQRIVLPDGTVNTFMRSAIRSWTPPEKLLNILAPQWMLQNVNAQRKGGEDCTKWRQILHA